MKGFAFAGIHAGIKKNGIKDLGLILCEKPAAAAAVFTRNQVRAAPGMISCPPLNMVMRAAPEVFRIRGIFGP